jgi:hypothetical protein
MSIVSLLRYICMPVFFQMFESLYMNVSESHDTYVMVYILQNINLCL